jgi:hypothetical protein
VFLSAYALERNPNAEAEAAADDASPSRDASVEDASIMPLQRRNTSQHVKSKCRNINHFAQEAEPQAETSNKGKPPTPT